MQYLLVIYLTNILLGGILLGMAKIQLSGYRCERCDHEWVPRDKDEEPRVCPKCKSPYWNKPRRADNSKATKK
jgi:DNA-directed RNA polymerase subunit RPC12/RpoP